MRWFSGILLVLFVISGGFLLVESPIDSVAWKAPEALPMVGKLAPNDHLEKAELLAQGEVYGPEDTTVDANGVLYTGTQDGWIVRVWPDGRVEKWLETGGRPLGMVFDHQGNLIVADAWKGLLSISPDSTITLLTLEAEGQPFGFTDDVDIAPDGRIYFTDASSRFHQPDYMLDLLEFRPHGRLLRYDPASGETEVLLRDLYFANGVAVSPGGDYLLVNETWKYRITRYWISGPRAGTSEVFADNLPGLPDNLAVDGQGRYWVAFPAPRDPQIDTLHTRPWLKDQLVKLPESFRPKPKEYGLVVAFNDRGQMLVSLQDTDGSHLQEITSVNPHDGVLYFGSLHNDRIGRMSLDLVPGLADGD